MNAVHKAGVIQVTASGTSDRVVGTAALLAIKEGILPVPETDFFVAP
jgi:predicted alternative tryptophan synthase beta-subunit